MMETIKDILGGLLRRRKLDKTLSVYRVFNVWNEAVGVRIARHSQPKGYKNGTLLIAVDSSTWMQQLTFLTDDIRRKVNQALGAPLVEKIRFQIGELDASSGAIVRKPSPPAWSDAKLDDHSNEVINQVLAPVQDEELKERLRQLFEKNSQFLRHYGKE